MDVRQPLAIWLALLVVTWLSLACGPSTTWAVGIGSAAQSQPKHELLVLAAASLSDAFVDMAAAFEAERPEAKIVLSLAGSQQLAQQIVAGAPADVFASASPRQMDAAVGAGRVDRGQVRPFAHNRLIVVIPVDNPAHVTELEDLARPGVKLVVADASVPVGQYTLDFLERASVTPRFAAAYRTAVLSNVVSYENNVRAVLAKVLLGEADAAVVYASDVTPSVRDRVATIEIPDGLNATAVYPIAPLKDSASSQLAKEFTEFVLSPRGQAVLERYGFQRVQ